MHHLEVDDNWECVPVPVLLPAPMRRDLPRHLITIYMYRKIKKYMLQELCPCTTS